MYDGSRESAGSMAEVADPKLFLSLVTEWCDGGCDNRAGTACVEFERVHNSHAVLRSFTLETVRKEHKVVRKVHTRPDHAPRLARVCARLGLWACL